MSIRITDDPLGDYSRWEHEQYLWEQSRPVCFECGEHITDDYEWIFNGYIYCEDCVEKHREFIED